MTSPRPPHSLEDAIATAIEDDAPASKGAIPPKKLNWTHDAMIDLIITDPRISQGELANHFGYTQSWISIVMGTDMWKARLAARRDEIVDPVIKASLDERFRAMVEASLERLQEKLNKPNPPDNLVLRAVELGAKALGFGQIAPPPPPPESAATERLARLAERLLSFQTQARINHVHEVPQAVVLENDSDTIDIEVRPQPLERSISNGGEERADEAQSVGRQASGDWRQATRRA